MSQQRAPIFEALLRYRETHSASFHVPGHKGRVYGSDEADVFRSLIAIDVTEISGMDDLHQPTGMIQEAQQLAAKCFGADESIFLVGGSTAGNISMIMGVCGPEDLIIIDRQVHKSIIHGIMLSGANVVFLPVQMYDGIALGASISHIDEALIKYPQAKAVLITYPNYYGYGVDIQAAIETVHRRGKPILVDEAHGAHFGLHTALPASSVKLGADAVVQSMHKMGNALTMGAILHLNGERIPRAEVKQYAAMLQTSSPSYPILASLDICRRTFALHGHKYVEAALTVIQAFRERMTQFPWFSLSEPNNHTPYFSDPMKITVRDRTGLFNGYKLQSILEQEGCIVEMADPENVLFIFSIYSTQADAQRLLTAFAQISARHHMKDLPVQVELAEQVEVPPIPGAPMRIPKYGQPLEQGKASMMIAMEDAEGCFSAEMVIPYPPGIPLLFRGERITKSSLDVLLRIRDSGGKLQGLADPKMKQIQVWKT